MDDNDNDIVVKNGLYGDRSMHLHGTVMMMITRMHFSRMHTACSSACLGGGRQPVRRRVCPMGVQPPGPRDRHPPTDRQVLKHYLPTTSFAGGNNDHKFCYHPQGSCGKVMFLHLSVILFTGGVAYTPREQTPPSRYPPAHCMLGDTGNKRAVTTTIGFVVAEVVLNGFCSRSDANESDRKCFVFIIVPCERYVHYEDENKV